MGFGDHARDLEGQRSPGQELLGIVIAFRRHLPGQFGNGADGPAFGDLECSFDDTWPFFHGYRRVKEGACF
jgi:hypothetical protein